MLSLKVIKEIYATDGLNEAKKAFSELGSPLDSFVGKATIATATTYALYKAIQALSDAYNLSYASAIKNTEESLSSFSSTKTEVEDLTSQVDTAKESLTSMADTYNIEIDGTESITELIDKLQSSDLSLEDRAQVSQIEQENASLERQIALKQKLLEYQQKEAASNAMDTMGRGEQSVAQQVAQKVPGGKKTYQGTVSNVNVVDAVKENVSAIQEYENKIADLEKKQASFDPGSKQWKQAQEDIDSYNEAIQTLTTDLDSKEGDLTTLLQSFSVNGEGLVALKGYEEQFNSVKEAFNSINNIDLTPAQQQLASIESFFDGSTKSNAIKEKLLEAVKSGESATDALHAMGITLNDLGITGEDKKKVFDDYFNGLIESSKEAENAIKSVDGTVNGVKAAKKSANQDQDWSDMVEALENAKELYSKGKVGTDDFQTATQFMTYEIINSDADGFKYDADAFVQYWQNAQAKVARYFDKNNPLQSVLNFSNDLVNSGLATKVGDEYTWSFKNSAQAAKELGVSVEAVETLMHSLESYGAEFDEVMWSGEGIEEYKSALDGISDMYDTITDKESKDRLEGILNQAQIDDFENNLEKLSPEIIANLKFEYNLAEIQQQIENLQNDIKTSGGSTEQWGALVSVQTKKRDKLSSQDGMSSAVNDSGYQASVEQVDKLSNKLLAEYDKLGESGRRSIEQQQSALVEFQNSYLEMFQSGDVVNWEEFLNSNQLPNVLNDISTRTGIEIADLQQLFGVDLGTIPLDAEINLKKDDIEKTLKEFSEGGNVDLTVRPVIDSSELANAGWDVPSGETATVYTSTYGNKDGTIAMNFTPIITDENGNFTGVMSPEQLQQYAEEVIDGVREDDLNLKVGATFNGEKAIDEADKVANEIHQLHQDYFDDNNTNIYDSNGNVDTNTYVVADGSDWNALELDLGKVYADIDYIQTWHYYDDNRVYNHRLEVSSDRSKWYTLYDSDIQGGYAESDIGKVHDISNNVINEQLTSFAVRLGEIESNISDGLGKVNQSISTAEGNMRKIVNDSIDEAKKEINGSISELPTTDKVSALIEERADRITTEMTRVTDDLTTRVSKVEQDSDKWSVKFAELGMGEADGIETIIKL